MKKKKLATKKQKDRGNEKKCENWRWTIGDKNNREGIILREFPAVLFGKMEYWEKY